MIDARSDVAFWVFGYGSLMWNPGFAYVDRQLAVLPEWHRSFCMWSIHHRGTEEDPGLVLALDAQSDARCQGVAFAVDEITADATLAELRERELISSAYLETTQPLILADGRQIEAITYVVDRDHRQYCGGLPLAEQAQIIAHAQGGRGSNAEYLFNTVEHLHELTVPDADLDWLAARVRRITSP